MLDELDLGECNSEDWRMHIFKLPGPQNNMGDFQKDFVSIYQTLPPEPLLVDANYILRLFPSEGYKRPHRGHP